MRVDILSTPIRVDSVDELREGDLCCVSGYGGWSIWRDGSMWHSPPYAGEHWRDIGKKLPVYIIARRTEEPEPMVWREGPPTEGFTGYPVWVRTEYGDIWTIDSWDSDCWDHVRYIAHCPIPKPTEPPQEGKPKPDGERSDYDTARELEAKLGVRRADDPVTVELSDPPPELRYPAVDPNAPGCELNNLLKGPQQ